MIDELNNIMNQEIARELLLAQDPDISDTTFDYVWSLCNGNPWDCPVMYGILKAAGKIA